MTKEEITQEIKAAGLWQTKDESSRVWRVAFDMYYEATGERLDLRCNKCYAKVKEWLEKKP